MKHRLDEEEQEILDSFENGSLKPAQNMTSLHVRLQEAAKNTLKKDKRVTNRISGKDLYEFQVLAIQDGIPYQTLMSRVLHKYASGQLKEKVSA